MSFGFVAIAYLLAPSPVTSATPRLLRTDYILDHPRPWQNENTTSSMPAQHHTRESDGGAPVGVGVKNLDSWGAPVIEFRRAFPFKR
jgi:hypothetical protein